VVAQSELRELREADLPAAASQQVRFGSQLRDRGAGGGAAQVIPKHPGREAHHQHAHRL